MDATRLTIANSGNDSVHETSKLDQADQYPLKNGYSPELTGFLKNAKAKNIRAVTDIVVCGWGRIALAVGIFACSPSWLTYAISIYFISSGMGILVALSHESQHSALFRNKKWNDLVGAWLCAYPVGSVYSSSRAVHLAHHKYLNTALDPDRHFHFEEDKSTPKQFASYFLRLLCGGQLWTSIVVNGFLRKADLPAAPLPAAPLPAAPKETGLATQSRKTMPLGANTAKRKIPEIANLLPVQAILFVVLWTVTGFWWAYFALWLVPIFTLGTFFGYLRGFIDHARLENDDGKLAAARLISVPNPSIADRLLLTGLDFHYHAEHHFFPAVPHYYLPELHKILQNDPAFRDRYLVRPTYFSFLREYWKQISVRAR